MFINIILSTYTLSHPNGHKVVNIEMKKEKKNETALSKEKMIIHFHHNQCHQGMIFLQFSKCLNRFKIKINTIQCRRVLINLS